MERKQTKGATKAYGLVFCLLFLGLLVSTLLSLFSYNPYRMGGPFFLLLLLLLAQNIYCLLDQPLKLVLESPRAICPQRLSTSVERASWPSTIVDIERSQMVAHRRAHVRQGHQKDDLLKTKVRHVRMSLTRFTVRYELEWHVVSGCLGSIRVYDTPHLHVIHRQCTQIHHQRKAARLSLETTGE